MALHAGYGERDVTPSLGDLIGFGKVEHIDGKIMAKAVYLFDETNKTAVVLAMADLEGFTRDVDIRIRTAMAAELGIPVSHVCLNASHNHTGPKAYAFIHRLFIRYKLPHVDLIWLHRVETALVAAAREAKANCRPIRVEASACRVKEVAANRTIVRKDGTVVTRHGLCTIQEDKAEPEGIIDPSVTVLRLTENTGRPVVTLFNYACHPTAIDAIGRLSSPDYAGYAAEIIERETAGPAFFLQGACGNVGTGKYSDGSIETSRKMGSRLASAVMTALDGAVACASAPLQFSSWEQTVELDAHLPTEQAAGKELARLAMNNDVWEMWRIGALIEVVHNMDAAKACRLFVIRCGDWSIAGLPAESFIQSALAIKSASPHPFTMVGAYYDCTLWYIPTWEAYRDNVYEAGGGWNYVAAGTSERLCRSVITKFNQIQ